MKFKDFCNDLDTNKTFLLQAIDNSKKDVQVLLDKKDKNYNNFVKPFYKSYYEVHHHMNMISNIDSCLNSKKSSEVYGEVLPIIDTYEVELSTNEDIYKSFTYIQENDKSTDKVQKRVLSEAIKDFELSGVNLPKDKKGELKNISIQLGKLSKEFSQNLIDADNEYEMILDNYEDVKELPLIDLEQSKTTIGKRECYKFTLKMPSYIAYMTYGSNLEKREELYKAYTTRAPQNEDIINKILHYREQEAKLLGFDNFASMSISHKDAPSVKAVEDFLYTVADKAKLGASRELEDIQEFAQTKINAFDIAYYSQKMKKKYHDIDEEEYMNYFEINHVLECAINFIQDSFGVKIQQNQNVIVWDEKVKVYDFYENDKCFGRIYFDLESRDNKKSGAWMHNFETHHIDEQNQEQLASAFIICNFMKSSSKNPSLLKHNDIVTMFHELGHGIHHIFSKVSESSLSGVNGIAWDVVEFPSQFLEQFAYDKKVLQDIGIHYKDKTKLSDNMIEKLINAKNFQATLGMIRQCEFAIFDILLHKKLYSGKEVQNLLDDIRTKYSALVPPSYNKFQNGFSHIFSGGYASGYYSYKWAEVLSADLYIANTKENILDKYKQYVLEQSASENMGVLFESITNKQPDIKALFELYDIKE